MEKEDLILVIDMQNVYLSGQKWVCLDTGGITCPVFEKSVYSSLKVPEIKRAVLEVTALMPSKSVSKIFFGSLKAICLYVLFNFHGTNPIIRYGSFSYTSLPIIFPPVLLFHN